jgi:hypothetical protein
MTNPNQWWRVSSSGLWRRVVCWVATQQITRRHIPEVDTLHNHRCENLKSYKPVILKIFHLSYHNYFLNNRNLLLPQQNKASIFYKNCIFTIMHILIINRSFSFRHLTSHPADRHVSQWIASYGLSNYSWWDFRFSEQWVCRWLPKQLLLPPSYLNFNTEDGCNIFHQYVGNHISGYMTSHAEACKRTYSA